MFDRTGEKIKTWGTILFILGIISSGIAAILLWGKNSDFTPTILPGFLVLILGILSSYIVSLFICGFGTLIEETELNRSVNEQILHAMEQLPTSSTGSEVAKSIDTAENRATHRASPSNTAKIYDGKWCCKSCGTLNSSSDLICKNCSKYR